jgi:hypothetical protein
MQNKNKNKIKIHLPMGQFDPLVDSIVAKD